MDMRLLNGTFQIRLAQLPFEFVAAASRVELPAGGRGDRGDFFVAGEEFSNVYKSLGDSDGGEHRACCNAEDDRLGTHVVIPISPPEKESVATAPAEVKTGLL